jgi:hypothetical protein
VLDSEWSSPAALVQIGVNVELFYFFDILEKTDGELFAKKNPKYFFYPERLRV